MGHPELDIEVGVILSNETGIWTSQTSQDGLRNLSEIGHLWML